MIGYGLKIIPICFESSNLESIFLLFFKSGDKSKIGPPGYKVFLISGLYSPKLNKNWLFLSMFTAEFCSLFNNKGAMIILSPIEPLLLLFISIVERGIIIILLLIFSFPLLPEGLKVEKSLSLLMKVLLIFLSE